MDWPQTIDYDNGNTLDLSLMPPQEASPRSFKLSTPRLAEGEGWATLHGPRGSLKVDFDPAQIPYLGLWLNFGKWEGLYHLTIEPSLSNRAALSMAQAENTALTLPPGLTYSWEVHLSLI